MATVIEGDLEWDDEEARSNLEKYGVVTSSVRALRLVPNEMSTAGSALATVERSSLSQSR